MMTMKEARELWKHYDLSEEDLKEWLWVRNNRGPDPPDVHKGETVEVTVRPRPHPPAEEAPLKSST